MRKWHMFWGGSVPTTDEDEPRPSALTDLLFQYLRLPLINPSQGRRFVAAAACLLTRTQIWCANGTT